MIHCGSIVADVSETWAVVMPYKFGSAEVIVNWECSTVPVAFVEKWKSKKLEVGTTILNWDRKLFIVEAGTSFGIGTESCSNAWLSICVSYFKGIVKK
jgi:hypothetical protein